LSGATYETTALFVNIRLGYMWTTVTDTLAYKPAALIISVKKLLIAVQVIIAFNINCGRISWSVCVYQVFLVLSIV